jgi:hypothetical protein
VDPNIPGDPNDVGTAQALFEANVRGAIMAACGTAGGCHVAQDPAFVTMDLVQAYDKINGYRDSLFPGYVSDGAKLLANGTGAHQGATFSADDVSAIQAWLAQEKLDAEAGGGVVASPLAIWSGCMNLDDWNEENVANEWSNKNANGQGRCEACHNLGADGFIASDQSERVFQVITTLPAFMPSYFTLDATGSKVVVNRARLEAVGNQLAPHQAHGSFNVDGDAMDALNRFYDKTLARQAAGNCGPPRF